MSKRRITKQQQARISKQQEKRLQGATESQQPQHEGLLVAHYGVFVDVEDRTGKIYRCNIRQNLGPIVPGDRVLWSFAHTPAGHELRLASPSQVSPVVPGVLVAVKPRKNLLSRPAARGKVKPIAANIDQAIIVIAPEPKLAASLVDSYLVALETLKLTALIICNKSDLVNRSTHHDLLTQIALYQHIGYPVLLVSAQTHEGLSDLQRSLHGQTSIFVGQSGVGKSSLISSLLPETALKPVAPAASDHGTHTTTTARLYHLLSGGDLIDSPGIREFMLWDMPAEEIAQGFVEFQPYLTRCKFRNCQHLNEQNCAILQAVADGVISETRLNSYRRIVNSCKTH